MKRPTHEVGTTITSAMRKDHEESEAREMELKHKKIWRAELDRQVEAKRAAREIELRTERDHAQQIKDRVNIINALTEKNTRARINRRDIIAKENIATKYQIEKEDAI